MAQLKSSDTLVPNEEYEAQFYGFLPSSLVQGIVRIIEDRTAIAIDEVEENLSQVPESLLSKDELKSGMEKFRSKVMKNSEKTLTKLQDHLVGEVLRLPEHLLLPCDMEQARPADLLQVSRLQDSLADLRTQYSNELYMQAAFRAELEEGKKVLAQQERVLNELLTPNLSAACVSLSENLEFVKDNRTHQKKVFEDFERRVKATSEDLDEHQVSTVPTPTQALLGRLLQ